MNVEIIDYELNVNTHNLYKIIYDEDQIETLVTHTPSMVTSWISKIERMHRHRLHKLIVGLDIEWRPNNRHCQNPVATLQLCVGRQCLIFQLIYAPNIPESLTNFLTNSNYTFVGVGIYGDVEKITEDCGLEVTNTVDLRGLAEEVFGRSELRNAGLKRLTEEVLGREIVKSKWVTRSRWDSEWLTDDQILYACLDAFLSFEIGRVLNASG